jgi:DNA-binding beta-propeller fold protein YncE
MFVLNAKGGFISYLTLRDNIISVNNSFFTGIYVPICLTYDTDTDSLYLLSGAVPNTRITRINARTGAVITILPIPFGALYDPNGLTIDRYHGLFSPINDQPPTDTKYLYVSNTDQNDVNTIKRINITEGIIPAYPVTTLISGLTDKPFTMATQNDGFLYVANKTSNNISKISLTGLEPSIQSWAVNGISVPSDLCFDNLGDLFVANSGTSPRNSRVSKIYTNYFFFTDVKLATGTCDNAEIFDITTQSCVEVDYYPPPSDPCIFPIPIPYPIGS